MKNLISFLSDVFRVALQSIALSAFCFCVQWVLHVTGVSQSEATIEKFIYGAIGFFFVLFLLYTYKTTVTKFHCSKDPAFMDAHLTTGISWGNYKRLKKQSSLK